MAFTSLFWGFLLMVNYYINGINILPSFAGFFLIYRGLGKLKHLNVSFNKAHSLAFPLIFFAIPNLYQTNADLGSMFLIATPGVFGSILAFVTSIIQIMLTYHICLGIMTLAEQSGNINIANKANLLWKIYVVVVAFMLVSYFKLAAFISTPIALGLSVIYHIGLLFLLSKCSRELNYETVK